MDLFSVRELSAITLKNPELLCQEILPGLVAKGFHRPSLWTSGQQFLTPNSAGSTCDLFCLQN